MEKGLIDAVNVLSGWVSQVFNVLLNTALLPLNVFEALLR